MTNVMIRRNVMPNKLPKVNPVTSGTIDFSKLNMKDIHKNSPMKQMYEAEFVLSVTNQMLNGTGYPKVKILKNRQGDHDGEINESTYNYTIFALTEVAYEYLSKNKTNVGFFEESVKRKFEDSLKIFINEKWKELNEWK